MGEMAQAKTGDELPEALVIESKQGLFAGKPIAITSNNAACQPVGVIDFLGIEINPRRPIVDTREGVPVTGLQRREKSFALAEIEKAENLRPLASAEGAEDTARIRVADLAMIGPEDLRPSET